MPSAHDVLTLRKWTKAVATESGIKLRTTHSMMYRIWKRTTRVVAEFKRLRHGRQQAEYLERNWNLTLKLGDIQTAKDVALEEKVSTVLEKNKALKKEKIQLEKENSQLKQSREKLSRNVQRLSKQMQKARADGYQPSRGHSRVKSPSKCTARHQRNLKRKRLDSCSESLSWLEAEGYTATRVEIRNDKTGETELLQLDPNSLLDTDETISEEQANIVNMLLYVKDRHNVSGDAYHEMAQLCKAMPRHYKLKQRITELNRLWNIQPTPEGTCGVQQSLEERLKYCLQHLVSYISFLA